MHGPIHIKFYTMSSTVKRCKTRQLFEFNVCMSAAINLFSSACTNTCSTSNIHGPPSFLFIRYQGRVGGSFLWSQRAEEWLRMSEAETPFPIRLHVVQGGKLPSSLLLNTRNSWQRKALTQWAADRQLVKSLWKFSWENSSIISTDRPSNGAVYATVSKKTSLCGSYIRN